jgi:hypothetical protein
MRICDKVLYIKRYFILVVKKIKSAQPVPSVGAEAAGLTSFVSQQVQLSLTPSSSSEYMKNEDSHLVIVVEEQVEVLASHKVLHHLHSPSSMYSVVAVQGTHLKSPVAHAGSYRLG